MPRRVAATAAVALAALALAAPAEAGGADPCDPTDPAPCLFPWPHGHFMERGHLALRDSMMPRNKDGVPVAAGDYNDSDGFSPGSTVVTKVPGLDTPEAFIRTGAVPITDIGRSFDRD